VVVVKSTVQGMQNLEVTGSRSLYTTNTSLRSHCRESEGYATYLVYNTLVCLII